MTATLLPLRKLGTTGIRIPMLSLGSWNTFGSLVQDQRQVQDIVHSAYDYGVRYFDMANNYGNSAAERRMGAALRDLPRESLILGSKVFMPMQADGLQRGLSRSQIRIGIEGSLKRIGTDYLDIYYCHRFDSVTPLEETVAAMDELVREGKIRYWGTSMWTAAQIKRAVAIAKQGNLALPQVEQPVLNMIEQLRYRVDTLPLVQRQRLGVVTFSPLASGLLTGKYDEGIPPDSRLAHVDFLREDYYKAEWLAAARRLKSLADRLGCSRAQLAIAWAASQPGVSSVITGASRREQLAENMGAKTVALSASDLKELNALFAPHISRRLCYRARFLLRQLRRR